MCHRKWLRRAPKFPEWTARAVSKKAFVREEVPILPESQPQTLGTKSFSSTKLHPYLTLQKKNHQNCHPNEFSPNQATQLASQWPSLLGWDLLDSESHNPRRWWSERPPNKAKKRQGNAVEMISAAKRNIPEGSLWQTNPKSLHDEKCRFWRVTSNLSLKWSTCLTFYNMELHTDRDGHVRHAWNRK